jgi:branched-chain amino acid transport system permease protein
VTFLPEVMRIDPIDSRIAYGLALIAVVMLIPGGVIAAVGRSYQWVMRTLRGPHAGSADPRSAQV